MSTTRRSQAAMLPPLVAGQRLDRATFHERYERMPPGTRAELIAGVVHMPSPLGYAHGETASTVVLWLGLFQRATPGVRTAIDATTELDDLSEPQPDASLRILEEFGGQSRVDEGYIAGAPELIAEVARTSRELDLGDKFRDYERTGVQEYVVIELDPNRISWFTRQGDRFVPLPPAPDGWFRSRVFPGLWLDPQALFSHDLKQLSAALDQGLASGEHAALVERLEHARQALSRDPKQS